jgi:hypothetical protein
MLYRAKVEPEWAIAQIPWYRARTCCVKTQKTVVRLRLEQNLKTTYTMLSSIKSIISGVVGWGGATAADNSTAAGDSDKTKAQEPEKHVEATRPVEKRDYTAAELKQFDGSVPDVAILIAIRGIIFDVSSRKDIYGTAPESGSHAQFSIYADCCIMTSLLPSFSFSPSQLKSIQQKEMHAFNLPYCVVSGIGGAYSWLAGREASRLLAKMAKDTGVSLQTARIHAWQILRAHVWVLLNEIN